MISNKLKEIYSNYDNHELFYDAIELSHPNFGFSTDLYPSETLYPDDVQYPNATAYSSSVFLIKANEDKQFNVDGVATLFIAYPFSILTPDVGDTQQDLKVVLDNVSREIIEGIERASLNSEIPIKMRYFVFVDGQNDSQITPMTLNLTNVSANLQAVSATATRSDLFKYYFPQGGTSVYDTRFKGLYL